MLIDRPEYLQILRKFKDEPVIKVITGVRRCGKSTLFELFEKELVEQGITQQQIQRINFEDPSYFGLTKEMKLYDFVKEKLQADQMNYIFLDEIQHVEEFERVVDGLQLIKNVDVYITGSNAYFLSSELATLLTGRYVEIKMLPLSFKEYVAAIGGNDSLANLYQSYLKSSLPYAINLKDDQTRRLYLSGIVDSILLNDVVKRIGVTNVDLLQRITAFLYDNIGSTISFNQMAKVLSNRGEGKIYASTVTKYVQGISDALLIYQARRYNIFGKQILGSQEKYYAVDIGLRDVLLGSKRVDQGHVLENIVYLELIRRGYDVFVGQTDKEEIDFVTIVGQKRAYYQVAASVLDPKTLARELRPFSKLKDAYPRYLLTFDEIGAGDDHEGVQQLNVLQWLLDK